MSHKFRRIAPSAAALLVAAGLAAPAFAADTTVTIAEGTTQTTAVTASPGAGDTFTLQILGTLRAGAASNVTNISVQGSGAGPVTIINDGRLQGRFNFPSATGPITLQNNTGVNGATGGWHTGGVTTLGSGADSFENGEEGTIAIQGATTFDFGAGSDSFSNAGRLIVGRNDAAGTLNLTNLETFENSGVIIFGSRFTTAGDLGEVSDGSTNDALIAPGVNFVGSGASRFAMDASLADIAQADCATPTAADCADFTGGSTDGQTLLTIRDNAFSNAASLNDGITLIVGSSAAEHFVLDPNSDHYLEQSSFGPVLQKGVVAYQLTYDEDGQRHMLVGLPADELFQGATFAASAHETWRSTTATWLTRQADLRGTPGGIEPGMGLWGRIGASASERELTTSYTTGAGGVYDYDLTHKQRNAHLVFGADVVSATTQDSAWVVGVMAGFVRSDVEYEATPTEIIDRGLTAGVYASYIGGPLFVDAVFNANILNMRIDVPNMGLDTGVNLSQDVETYGWQLEAGWRIDTGAGFFVEPLVGYSRVRTSFEDIEVPGGAATYDFDDDYISSRFGGGLRIGMESQLLGHAAAYSLTGRYWSESDAEYEADVIIVGGPPLARVTTTTPIMDNFSGEFTDISASVNLFSNDGGVSGFVNLGGKFGDDYEAMDAAVGVRLRW